MRGVLRSTVVLGTVLLLAGVPDPATAQECSEHFETTFDLIQSRIFDRRGCTSANCHSGPAPAGGLDLSPNVAYDNLLDAIPQSVPAERYPDLRRVVPGSKGASLLWLNLASATLPEQWKAPLRPMPSGGLPPITFEELAVVATWIEHGAPRNGVVPGSGELVDACLPPPKPLEVTPLPPPPPGVGVQLRAPRQVLPAYSEREVCFVSYYDVTAQVPEEFRGPGGATFRYKRSAVRMDPLSHHSVVVVYPGRTPIDSPLWGRFRCTGGSQEGAACQPTDPDACGGEGTCASEPVPSIACIGFGPGDASILSGAANLINTVGGTVTDREGIFAEAPLKGILVWNSHAFNVTDTAAKLDMWMNFEFAAPEEQRRSVQGIVDISAIAKMVVPAFGADEVCHHHVLPRGARMLFLSSHVHQRGKRFRIFHGDFACRGGRNNGDPCSPFGPDQDLPTRDLCAGATCAATQLAPPAPPMGDCDESFTVTVNELVLGVRIALGQASVDYCPQVDRNGNGAVTIDELLAAVKVALDPNAGDPNAGDPQASLLYTSLTYADPFVLTFDPPRVFGGPRATVAERTLTYCALYDNGFINPQEVKRNSRLPSNSGPCQPTHCTEGAVGEPCHRHTDCDSDAGARDGFCDACTVGFGVTTDDEMFVLVGAYLPD